MKNLTNYDYIERYIETGLTNHSPKWLHYLIEAEEIHTNYENITSIQQLTPNAVLNYVRRTLSLLEQSRSCIPEEMYWRLSTVLAYSEAAKGGTTQQRKKWLASGFNLMVHNEGSAAIFASEYTGYDQPLLYKLILTHGLIGQYIRGESRLITHETLMDTLAAYYEEEEGKKLLYWLNYCIIAGVSEELWESVKTEVVSVIQQLFHNKYNETFIGRIERLTSSYQENREEKIQAMDQRTDVETVLEHADLWYVEPSMHDFSFEDFWTILLLVSKEMKGKNIRHITFEKLMKQLHYDYKGKKHNNLYRKRVIEKYLSEVRKKQKPDTANVCFHIDVLPAFDTAYVSFKFSELGEALIHFCVEAEKAGGALNNRANVMLFDLFGLRRDAYDRFNNEDTYLRHMNSASDDKRNLLEFIKGKTIVDVGPGGGVLLDLLEEEFPNKRIIGIDISENVMEVLQKKKKAENRNWKIIKGDALQLTKTFAPESLDTIIYSSIIHELYSYIEYKGKKFNEETISAALQSAFQALKKGGRIIIRDGIMTEPKEDNRIIRFKDEKGMEFLELYAKDFRGGGFIQYDVLSRNEVRMPVNHAMEFLYTYTWGEDSYAHEVNEQFGYFTPNEYLAFIQSLFGESIKVMECRHYLQEGYPLHLQEKIDFEDEQGNIVPLPDSTGLLVLEKQ